MSPARRSGDRLLVVNADDFGLTEGTCQAILRAHRHGIVTSTSVLAVGRAFDRCARLLRDHPRLGVGVHLAVVGEDPPLLPARHIPSLVNPRGQFAPGWSAFARRALSGRIRSADLAREFAAQIERVAALGVRITHLDTHQHVHLWPQVARVVLDLACNFGIPVVRVPRSQGGRSSGPVVNMLAERLAESVRGAGLRCCDGSFGFDEAGKLERGLLQCVLAAASSSGARSTELIVHPGPALDPQRGRYAWGYRWGDELAALTDRGTRAAVAELGFSLATHAALAPVAAEGATA